VRDFQRQVVREQSQAAALLAALAQCRANDAELCALRAQAAAHAEQMRARDQTEAQLRKAAQDAEHNLDEAMVRVRGASRVLLGASSEERPEEHLLLTSYELFQKWDQVQGLIKALQ